MKLIVRFVIFVFSGARNPGTQGTSGIRSDRWLFFKPILRGALAKRDSVHLLLLLSCVVLCARYWVCVHLCSVHGHPLTWIIKGENTILV